MGSSNVAEKSHPRGIYFGTITRIILNLAARSANEVG